MKNGKILISIFSIIFITLYFPFGFTNNAQGKQINNDKTVQYKDSNNDIIETKIPNKPIKEDEEFNITFKIKSKNIKIKEYSYENNGFNVKSELNEKKQNFVIIDFLSFSSNSNYKFTINIILENGEKKSSSVYGYLSDNELFLSLQSAENAERKALSYYYSNGFIDESEYEKSIRELSNECIVEEISNTTNTKYSSNEDEVMIISSVSRDTDVKGYIYWIDDNGNKHPMQYILIGIYDDDTIGQDLVGYTTTNSNGYYSLSFNNVTFLENGGLDIYIVAYAQGYETNIVVQDGLSSLYQTYHVTSSVSKNVSTGSTIIKSLTVNMSNDTGRAFQVSQALIYGNLYVKEMGANVSEVTAIFPSSNTYYIPLLKDIYLVPGDYMDWDVILHEYGHHIQQEFGIEDSPGGDHKSSDNLAVTLGSKDEGIRLAWGEAWPTVFAILVTQYYSSTLNNISNIGDEYYQDTTDRNNIYSLEMGLDDGEAQERAIMGVLYDLYDSGTNETFDRVGLGHQKFWNLVINSKATTFSELTNYAYDYIYLNKDDFASLLVEHGMSANNLQINGGISETPPTFSWLPGGSSTSTTYQNDIHDLVVYDYYGREYYRFSGIGSTSYTLTESEWHNLLYTYGDKFSVVLISYETNSPITGGYRSERLTFTKPTLTPQTESFNFYSSSRYIEKIMELGPGQYKDFTVYFYSSGKKVIQTFGPKDAYLYIYDMNGNLIISNDDQGYGLNSWIVLDTTANTEYIIRVKFYSRYQAGEVKLGIFPTIFTWLYGFDSIPNVGELNSLTSVGINYLNNVNMLLFSVNETTIYTIQTDRYSEDSDYIDMYVYLIDVDSTEPCLFDDDSGGNFQSKITTQLVTGKTYLLLTSTYSIASQSGQFNLTITKS